MTFLVHPYFDECWNKISLVCFFTLALCTSVVRADDWPQWMGPDRNGTYHEAGVVPAIPAGGLAIKWRTAIHGGYAGPAVVGNRLYLMDYRLTAGEPVADPGQKPALEGFERLFCVDASTGQLIWQQEYPCSYRISYPAGPRATPTVADGLVVGLGAQGDLLVCNADDGTIVWKTNLPEKFHAPVPIWGFAAHPLVYSDTMVTMVGGDGQAVVAFHLKTGQVKWQSLSSSDAGYCPPVLLTAAGVQQLIVWHPQAVAGLNPDNGTAYWTVPHVPDYGMSIGLPQQSDNYLFVSGIVNKSKMLKLDPNQPTATVAWEGTPKTSLSVATMSPVLHDGIMYGCDATTGQLMAVRVEDGERLWQTYEPVRPGNNRRLNSGTVSVTRHTPSGKYFLFGETGLFTIAEMDANGYRSLGDMQIVEPTQNAFNRDVIWSHPAFANRTAFFRNDKELVAVDLSQK